jgi:hypothetical protein
MPDGTGAAARILSDESHKVKGKLQLARLGKLAVCILAQGHADFL